MTDAMSAAATTDHSRLSTGRTPRRRQAGPIRAVAVHGDDESIWQAARLGDTGAIGSLILAHEALVHYFLAEFRATMPPKTPDYQDAAQEGVIALATAIVRFDRSRGTAFSTYARFYIRAAAMRVLEARRPIRLPRREARPEVRFASLATTACNAEAEGVMIHELGALDPAESVASNATLAQLLRQLSQVQRNVVALRFGLAGFPAHTVKETATALGMTAAQVGDLEDRALQRLQQLSIAAINDKPLAGSEPSVIRS